MKVIPYSFIDYHFISGNFFFIKRKGIVGIGGYPLPPFTDNLVILRNGSIVCKQKHGESAAPEVLSELAFCP